MRKLAILAVLAATVCLIGADIASARGGRGGRGSSCGSSCGYSSGCGYSYGSCGSSYGGCGSSYGGCGSSYGGYGSSYGGGYSAGCGYGQSAGYAAQSYCGYAAPAVSYGCYGGVVAPMAPVPGGKKDGGKKDGDKKIDEQISAPATLVVSLPADATLKVDDYQTSSTSETRVFTTPVLAAGKAFSYTLKAEVVRDGKPVVVEQVVTVRAGETTPITLSLGAASGVASR